MSANLLTLTIKSEHNNIKTQLKYLDLFPSIRKYQVYGRK